MYFALMYYLHMLYIRDSVGTYQGNKLTRNSSGNACPQSSQLAEPPWTVYGTEWNTAPELISNEKKRFPPQIPYTRGKATTTCVIMYVTTTTTTTTTILIP